jgi:hypothetical protein
MPAVMPAVRNISRKTAVDLPPDAPSEATFRKGITQSALHPAIGARAALRKVRNSRTAGRKAPIAIAMRAAPPRRPGRGSRSRRAARVAGEGVPMPFLDPGAQAVQALTAFTERKGGPDGGTG